MFDTKTEDVKRLIYIQYVLIVVETPVGIYLTRRFPDFKLSYFIAIVLSIFVATAFLHLLIAFRASRIVRDFGLLLLATTVLATLTVVMHYIPSIRSALILMYIPSVIFAASQCLSFGIVVSAIMVVFFVLLTGGEYFNIHPIFKSIINTTPLGSSWQISNLFSFFFLLILAFLSNYFFEILRRRKKKIQHLAELNKKLYQESKTTSDEIFENMREALLVVDNNFNVVQYNNAFKNLAGLKINLINQAFSKLPLEYGSEIKKYLESIKDNPTKNLQFEAKDKTGLSYTINISTIDLKTRDVGFVILISRKLLPWGVVVDSQSKKPIDLALVRLHNAQNDKVLETKATDLEGRFGFILIVGEYYISVSKEGYVFPTKIKSKAYKGEKFKVKSNEEGAIELNIPIDKY